MRPVPAVVIDEHLKDSLEVRLVENQELVETLGAYGAHDPLGDPVGLGGASRRPNDLNPVADEHDNQNRR
jgi:hypothetical protein